MDLLTAWVYAGLRALIQALLPSLAGVLALLPPEQRDALTVVLVTVAGAAVMGAIVAGIRWLETRTGDSFGARAARFVARLIMLGLSKWQPVYTPASPNTVPDSVTTLRAPGVPQRAVDKISTSPVLRE